MVVLCVATLWVTTKNAPFSDRNKSFQTFLKTFEIASLQKMILFHDPLRISGIIDGKMVLDDTLKNITKKYLIKK